MQHSYHVRGIFFDKLYFHAKSCRQAFMAAAPSGPTTDLVSLKSLYITALVIFAVGVLEQRKIFN